MQKKRLVAIVAAIVAVVFGALLWNANRGPTQTTATVDEHGHEAGEEEAGHEEGEGDEHASEEIKFEGDAAQTAGVRLAMVQLAPLAKTIPFNGQIAPNPNGVVRVSSIVPGRITRLLVSQGDTVKQGQTLAVVESRAIGEAQSAHQQAVSRFETAKSNLDVVLKQARAGVFSRAPVEAARRAVVEARGEVRAGETAVRAARTALENATRLARAGSFANPAVEAARAQVSSSEEALKTAQAALDQAEASTESAQAELERRRQLAAGGAYVSRPVEEARRVLVAAQSAHAAARAEVGTPRANLSRARSLAAEGLVAQRDLENAQQAFETAEARLETSQADEQTARQELERQQKLAATNVAGAAEVQAAQGELSRAQAEVRSQRAQVQRARDAQRLAQTQLAREQRVFNENIANRREVAPARSTLENAENALAKARQTLALANTASAREQRIFEQNLNNIAQVQQARAGYAQAQSDLRAARSTLALFKSSPGRSASVPIVAPISGTVQERDVAQGEVLEADTHLMTLVNLSAVAVEAALPERDVSQVRIGSPVSVTVDAVPGRRFAGRITFIGSQLNPQTRTLTARALIPSAGVLRPGMFARGQIQTGVGASAVTVPAAAVQEMDGGKVVFVAADEPNTFVKRQVVVGATEGGRTTIKSGLKIGDRAVVEGAFLVKAQAMKAELGHSH